MLANLPKRTDAFSRIEVATGSGNSNNNSNSSSTNSGSSGLSSPVKIARTCPYQPGDSNIPLAFSTALVTGTAECGALQPSFSFLMQQLMCKEPAIFASDEQRYVPNPLIEHFERLNLEHVQETQALMRQRQQRQQHREQQEQEMQRQQLEPGFTQAPNFFCAGGTTSKHQGIKRRIDDEMMG